MCFSLFFFFAGVFVGVGDGVPVISGVGDGRTRATYVLDADPGRVLGLVIRGPVEAATRAIFVNGRPGELKRRAERA